MDFKSSSDNIHPIWGGRGIQEAQVWEAADVLLREGLRPTIERVRQKIGSGSPNTVSPMLERWFATLGKRLGDRAVSVAEEGVQQLPLAITQAAQKFWDTARREADQMQVRQSEASRRELELERDALAAREAELQQRETAFEQSRLALDEALASSRQAVTAMESQMLAQQEESARLLGNAEAEVRRLRKALEEATAGKEALREKSAMELVIAQRAAQEAEERHLAQERRLLAELDRERLATRHAGTELAKEQKAHAAEADAARVAQALAQKQEASHRERAAAWAHQHHSAQVELATLRERAAAAEQRAADLVLQIQRQQDRSAREIERLEASQATTTAILHQLQAREVTLTTAKKRAPRARKPS